MHGETEAKEDFAQIIGGQFGYHPVVVRENSEFVLETGELLSKDEVIREVMTEENVSALKDKIVNIKAELDKMLSGTQSAMEQEISVEKLQQINNIILELEKASVNLGSSITAENRDETPLSEQK